MDMTLETKLSKQLLPLWKEENTGEYNLSWKEERSTGEDTPPRVSGLKSEVED